MDPERLYWLKQFIWVFLLPPNGFLVLALIGVVMAGWSRRHYRFGAVVSITALLLFYLVMTPAVSQKLMAFVEHGVGDSLDEEAARALMAGPQPPQAIVILGSGSLFDARERPLPETPSGHAWQRIVHGARLARWTSLPVLTTGGRPAGQPVSEGTIMARSLLDLFGVPVRWIEGESFDTTGNAVLSAPVLKGAGVTRVLLVTEAFHMRRARSEFEAAGIQVVPAPHAWRSQRGLPLANTWMPTDASVSRASLAIHEIVGQGWYAARRAIMRMNDVVR